MDLKTSLNLKTSTTVEWHLPPLLKFTLSWLTKGLHSPNSTLRLLTNKGLLRWIGNFFL